MIYPKNRVDSDKSPAAGQLVLPANCIKGTLLFNWDNSHSWMTKKELSWSIKIETNEFVGDAHGDEVENKE